MIVGDNAIGNVKGTSLSQIKRPLDKTILIIESDTPVPWMSPTDFTVEDFATALYVHGAHAIRSAEIQWEEEEDRIRGDSVYPSPPSQLDKRKIIGVHGRELDIILANGMITTYLDYKLPLSEIETMSRISE
jgi:hypothetical protein